MKASDATGLDHGLKRVKLLIIEGLVAVLTLLGEAAEAADASSKAVLKIALGSCANEDRDQPIWDPIVEQNPDLFRRVASIGPSARRCDERGSGHEDSG